MKTQIYINEITLHYPTYQRKKSLYPCIKQLLYARENRDQLFESLQLLCDVVIIFLLI